MTTTTLIQADARRCPLADKSVQMVCTSPPYYSLRDYGVHGQIGLESSVAEYLQTMVQVFREVRRVLRDDGTVWCNMGDSYSQSQMGRNRNGCGNIPAPCREFVADPGRGFCGIAPKNLLGIPWRLAFALQDDGWILRSDIIWSKPNPMPESVTDRPTKSHEYVFLLAKRERYFYDAEAVREKAEYGYRCTTGGKTSEKWGRQQVASPVDSRNPSAVTTYGSDPSAGRNLRSVWTITPRAFTGAHFATFPSELVERCVKAGTSERGQCPKCGKAWERQLERTFVGSYHDHKLDGIAYGLRQNGKGPATKYERPRDLGWRPGCTCPPHEPVPQVVFDPFGGAGTVPLVASNLGRRGVMTELNPAYIALARRRISRPHSKPERVEREEHHPLFAGIE